MLNCLTAIIVSKQAPEKTPLGPPNRIYSVKFAFERAKMQEGP